MSIETSANMIEIGNCESHKFRESIATIVREMHCESLCPHKCHKVRQFRNSGLYSRYLILVLILPRLATNRVRRSKDRAFLLKSQSGARTLVWKCRVILSP